MILYLHYFLQLQMAGGSIHANPRVHCNKRRERGSRFNADGTKPSAGKARTPVACATLTARVQHRPENSSRLSEFTTGQTRAQCTSRHGMMPGSVQHVAWASAKRSFRLPRTLAVPRTSADFGNTMVPWNEYVAITV